MKVGILDDERHCVESLALHLQSLPNIEIVFKSTNPVELLKKLPDLKIDLLFLDVQMPAMDGFEFLKKIDQIDFDVIFTTAYSQYAVKAFKTQAVNYLLKPIDDTELEEALEAYRAKSANTDIVSEVENLLQYFSGAKGQKDKIAVPVFDGIEFVSVDDIVYCKSESNYTSLILNEGKSLLFSKTLKETEKTLSKYGFLRVHQSYLINPAHMTKFVRADGGFITMSNGDQLPISGANRKLISDYFDSIRGN